MSYRVDREKNLAVMPKNNTAVATADTDSNNNNKIIKPCSRLSTVSG